jgi:acyl-CoA thioesterase
MTPLESFFSWDRLAKTLGIVTLSLGEGRAEASMTVADLHLNGLNTVHGGALFSLADYAFALACNSRKLVTVALTATISFTKAVGPGSVLRAIAEEVSTSSRTGVYSVRIVDGTGEIVASFQGTAYRKRETIEEFLEKTGRPPFAE